MNFHKFFHRLQGLKHSRLHLSRICILCVFLCILLLFVLLLCFSARHITELSLLLDITGVLCLVDSANNSSKVWLFNLLAERETDFSTSVDFIRLGNRIQLLDLRLHDDVGDRLLLFLLLLWPAFSSRLKEFENVELDRCLQVCLICHLSHLLSLLDGRFDIFYAQDLAKSLSESLNDIHFLTAAIFRLPDVDDLREGCRDFFLFLCDLL